MAKFMSGPPGGRTLPLTPTKLSDLDGGAYGPGASVASTGLNANRPVIRAASARQAGETWEDVLEYYMVSLDPNSCGAPIHLEANKSLVQRRPRRDRLCLPTWQDFLPGLDLFFFGRNVVWRRRCWCHSTRFSARAVLLHAHRTRNMATRYSWN